jgi:peptidoglycan hydrolase-like protein with peptidoglycan-binding domain
VVGAVVAAAVSVGVLTGAPGASAAQAAGGDPVSPVPAPAVVEGWSPYLGQVSCDPTPKAGTSAVRQMVMSAYGGRDSGIGRSCSVGGGSEHKEGRAWDWGLDAGNPAEKAQAERFLTWLLAPGPNGMGAYNARRLGVMYVIWNRKVWSQYRAADGWRKYTGSSAHRDHVHISLTWNGATKRTSWWTGKASATDYGPCVEVEGALAPPWREPRHEPCPAPVPAESLTSTPLLKRGDSGSYVTQLQGLLSVEPQSGYFGPLTEAAVVALQKREGLPQSGTTTPPTWAAARAGKGSVTPTPSEQPVVAGRALPSRMTYRVRSGDSLSAIAKKWRSTVAAIRSASRLDSDVIQVGQRLVVPVRSSITKFTWTTLRKGDTGVAVKALQTALRMKPKYRTGYFGPKTKRKVKKLKAARGWRVNGRAGPGVWRALGA